MTRTVNDLRNKFKKYNIDGYVVPKNDEYFSEYSRINRLKIISNFSGSAGVAVILKKKNYLFVDGRYTIQAAMESGKQFQIIKYEKIINCRIFRNLKLGIDPKLFTSNQVKKYFKKYNQIIEIDFNLVDYVFNNYKIKSRPFYSLSKQITGESHFEKIEKISFFLKKNKSNYLFVSAPENVAWLLNIRGYDNPNSPIPNCQLIISDKKKIFLISELRKVKKLIKEKKINKQQIIEPKNFKFLIRKLNQGKIIIDKKSCSILNENYIKKKIKNT